MSDVGCWGLGLRVSYGILGRALGHFIFPLLGLEDLIY